MLLSRSIHDVDARTALGLVLCTLYESQNAPTLVDMELDHSVFVDVDLRPHLGCLVGCGLHAHSNGSGTQRREEWRHCPAEQWQH